MAKTIIMIFGVVLTLVGIAGFFVDGTLLGFAVDTVHNLIHLATGVAALALAMSESGAKTYGKIFGVVYLLVAILGFVLTKDGELFGMAMNMADNYLHTALALVFLYVGFGMTSASTSTPSSNMGQSM